MDGLSEYDELKREYYELSKEGRPGAADAGKSRQLAEKIIREWPENSSYANYDEYYTQHTREWPYACLLSQVIGLELYYRDMHLGAFPKKTPQHLVHTKAIMALLESGKLSEHRAIEELIETFFRTKNEALQVAEKMIREWPVGLSECEQLNRATALDSIAVSTLARNWRPRDAHRIYTVDVSNLYLGIVSILDTGQVADRLVCDVGHCNPPPTPRKLLMDVLRFAMNFELERIGDSYGCDPLPYLGVPDNYLKELFPKRFAGCTRIVDRVRYMEAEKLRIAEGRRRRFAERFAVVRRIIAKPFRADRQRNKH